MKRIGLFFALISTLLLCSCNVVVKVPVSPEEDFAYEMEDGEIVITDYVGTAREIHIPKMMNDRPVTTIGESAFEEYDLTRIILPDSVKTIAESAFSDCVCLEEIDMGDGVKAIEQYAFIGCEKLSKVKLSDSLESIGNSAFERCTNLAEISLPDSLLEIEKSAFDRCSSLNSVKLPEGLEYLGPCAFEGCTALSELAIPEKTNPSIKTTTHSTYVSIYDELSLPTASYGALSGAANSYAQLTTLSEEVKNEEKPVTVIIVKENSEALRQLREVEAEIHLNLEEEGLYKVVS